MSESNKFPGLDLGHILQEAARVSSESSDSTGMIKMLYPQEGSLKFRLIYNQQSGLVMRLLHRHKVFDEQYACLEQYSQECPICKTISDIVAVKGDCSWSLKRTTRGIAYAEYVGSDGYTWSDDRYAPEAGELVLLMFPWSVYTELNKLIAESKEHVYSLVASNVGGVFKISRSVEKKMVKYRTAIDPFEVSHQTRPTDEEYNKLISETESLNEKILPLKLTDEIANKTRKAAELLNQAFLAPHLVQPNLGQAGSNLLTPNTRAATIPAQAQAPVAQAAPVTPVPTEYTDPSGTVYDNIDGRWVPRVAAPKLPIEETQPAPTPAPVQQVSQSSNTYTDPSTGTVYDHTDGRWVPRQGEVTPEVSQSNQSSSPLFQGLANTATPSQSTEPTLGIPPNMGK